MNTVATNLYRSLLTCSYKQVAAWSCVVVLTLLVVLGNIAAAAPPAGATIGNQASATYSDSSQVTRTVTSNAVVTIVQQVASLTLTANGTKTGAIGGQVVYPHTLTNTGNGTDTFALSTTSNTGTTTLGSVVFYADANGDGVPDNSTPITSTGEVPAGGVFKYVVTGNVSGTAVAGNTNALTIAATSVFTGSVTASNTDTTTVTGQAVMQVSQSLDVTTGPSPSTSARTITITYANVGNTTATNVTLAELIPSGMTYVAGSARWSVTGSGTTLTDASNADNQSGIIYDYNITTATKATAVIASVAPGASGTLTFQVNVNSGLPPGSNSTTAMTATFAYNDGAANISATNTNTVQYTVAQAAAVALSASTVGSAPQGGTVSFTNTITNNGNGSDSFNMSTGTSTFPAGTTFQFYQADGVTPLLDSNGDGIPDSGPLAAAGTYAVVVKAILPPGATGGPYTVQVTATSRVDSTKSATATNTLTTINTSTVDATNNTAGSLAPGYGAGPEVSAAVTNSVNPGATTRYTLVIANSSGTADSFDLAASTDSSFATVSLPAGWTVVFKDSNGTVITNTGVINSATNKTIYADVTPPAGALAGTTDVYFRVRSPTSGATDRLHDALTVNTIRSFALAPNHSGQVTSGGIVVYSHTIVNTGNVLEGDGSASNIALGVGNNTSGFTSVIYWDKNNNGVLDVSDPVISNLSALTGGSNGASTAAGLAPGESALLLVKVIAPAGAATGTVDTTTLTATVTGTINSVAAPSAISATDNTSVIASQVTLSKLQALDAACDGTADTAFSSTVISTGAIPGACIRYQITASNLGASDITGLLLSDSTPANTLYHATVAAATSVGSITAPSNGSAGAVQATIGTLTPGQSAVMSFGVRIAP